MHIHKNKNNNQNNPQNKQKANLFFKKWLKKTVSMDANELYLTFWS